MDYNLNDTVQASEQKRNGSRWIGRGLIALAVVALLAGAAYLWGNPLAADTAQRSSESAAQRSADHFRNERETSALPQAAYAARSRGAGVQQLAAREARQFEAYALRSRGAGEQQLAAAVPVSRHVEAWAARMTGSAQHQLTARAARQFAAYALRSRGAGVIQASSANPILRFARTDKGCKCSPRVI